MFYLYALRCPITGQVRYIGKTKNPGTRLAAHISKARGLHTNHHCARWIRALLAKGREPLLEVIRRVPAGEDWQQAEIKCIAEYRASGHPLTNLTGGGDGFHDVQPEMLKRRGESRSRTLQDPDEHAKFVERMVLSRANPGTLALKSASARKAWADPEKRRRLLGGARDPGVVRRRSETFRRINSNPTYKAKQIAAMKKVMVIERATRRASGAVAGDARQPLAKRPQERVHQGRLPEPEVKARLRAAITKAWARRKAEAAGVRP